MVLKILRRVHQRHRWQTTERFAKHKANVCLKCIHKSSPWEICCQTDRQSNKLRQNYDLVGGGNERCAVQWRGWAWWITGTSTIWLDTTCTWSSGSASSRLHSPTASTSGSTTSVVVRDSTSASVTSSSGNWRRSVPRLARLVFRSQIVASRCWPTRGNSDLQTATSTVVAAITEQRLPTCALNYSGMFPSRCPSAVGCSVPNNTSDASFDLSLLKQVYRRRYEKPSLAEASSPNCIWETRNTSCGTRVSVPLSKFCENCFLTQNFTESGQMAVSYAHKTIFNITDVRHLEF